MSQPTKVSDRFLPLVEIQSVRERAADMRRRLDRRIAELEAEGEWAARSSVLDLLERLRARIEGMLAELDAQAEIACLERRRN